MKLTSENVETVFRDCLFQENEEVANALIIDGIMSKFGFKPEKVALHKNDIHSMLKELPVEFQEKSGGGMSFLNACNDKDGNQWTGLHVVMDQLFCLGMATEKCKCLMPREMWNILPGGMPYYVVLD
jgi:hypothetical protein